MKITTKIIRDTNFSFLVIMTKEDGKELVVKYEKGSSEYSNTCSDFHRANIELAIGNQITK